MRSADCGPVYDPKANFYPNRANGIKEGGRKGRIGNMEMEWKEGLLERFVEFNDFTVCKVRFEFYAYDS